MWQLTDEVIVIITSAPATFIIGILTTSLETFIQILKYFSKAIDF